MLSVFVCLRVMLCARDCLTIEGMFFAFHMHTHSLPTGTHCTGGVHSYTWTSGRA